MWFDYDRDGLLDLLICNYVKWTPETDVFCSADGKTKSYCTPEAYPGTTSWLFHNRRNGTFEDVTAAAGLFDPTSKALGVTMLDYDMDGWPDLFVANDTQPNKLYRNQRNGTFAEVGVQAGSRSATTAARAPAWAPTRRTSTTAACPRVAVTNFSGEMLGLYMPVGKGVYADRAPALGNRAVDRLTLGFGCFFFDADLDGLLDLLVVNGHIDESASGAARVHYAESPHLFHNRGTGTFVDVAQDIGNDFSKPKVGRGAAFGDFDLDGDLDVVVTTNGGAAHLYRNDLATVNRGRDLGVRIEAVADLQLLAEFGDAAHEFVVDLLDEQPRAGDADLARIGEHRHRGARHGRVEIGIGEHDVRRLAAELERDALEVAGEARMIDWPVTCEPVKATLSTSGCEASAAPAVSP